MPGFADRNSAAATPNRRTRIIFDSDERSVLEDAWSVQRDGYAISPVSVSHNYTDSEFSQAVRIWAGGAITLRPKAEILPWVQEGSHDEVPDNQSRYTPTSPVPETKLNVTGQTREFHVFKVPELPGIVYTPSVSLLGDSFAFTSVEAGDSWDGPTSVINLPPTSQPPTTALLTPPAATEPPVTDKPIQVPTPGTASVKVKGVGQSVINARADQPFFLRWFCPGSDLDNPDYTVGFQFGQYMLHMMGSGDAQLWESTHTAAGGEIFRLRKTFPYCKPSEVCDHAHTLMIFPMISRGGGKYLHFVSNNREDEEYYIASTLARGTDRDESPGHVTKSGPATMYHRADLRPLWVFSKLRWETQGFVTDQPMAIPKSPFLSDAQPLFVKVAATLPPAVPGSTPFKISLQLANAGTRDAPTNFAPFWTGIFRNGDPLDRQTSPTSFRNIYSTFWLYGDGTDTPILFGYNTFRDAIVNTVSPGEFEIVPERISVQGGDLTPQAERGTVELQDPGNRCPRLALRGEFPCKIVTDIIPPPDPDLPDDEEQDTTPQTLVVFRGYAIRPGGKRIGVRDPDALREGTIQGLKTGMGWEGSQIRQYPSSEWRQYEFDIVGMWRRLARDQKNTRLALSWRYFSEDPSGAIDPITGARAPWKVTDVMKFMLSRAGFPDSMVNIQDNPIRLWPGIGAAPEDQTLDIYTDFGSRLNVLARNYLGAIVIFDQNAGFEGQWTLIFGPGSSTVNVFQFLTYVHDPLKLPHHPGAYPANVGFISELGAAYGVAPECNHIWVFTAPPNPQAPGGLRCERHLFNPLSYKVPGSTINPDPDSPHWLPGGERLYVCPDPSLYVPYDLGATQSIVDFTARRLFMFTCLGSQVLPARAPYYVIRDPDHGHLRPLRIGDRVKINASQKWYVRNVSPEWEFDGMQMADYEFQRWAPYPFRALSTP